MQAIGDIISYFFPYYFNCHTKKSTKIKLGKNKWYFFPLCLYFFPLRPRNNCSTFTTVYWGGKFRKREIKSYFSRWITIFFCDGICVFQLGENIWYLFPSVFIFSPCVLIFSLLGHAINCSTFTGGVLGENILSLCVNVSPCVYVFPHVSMFFPLAMLHGIYFTFLPRQLLGYELEEKQYNIFPPGPVFFILVTEKLVKN